MNTAGRRRCFPRLPYKEESQQRQSRKACRRSDTKTAARKKCSQLVDDETQNIAVNKLV